jgi:hypothetical protein
MLISKLAGHSCRAIVVLHGWGFEPASRMEHPEVAENDDKLHRMKPVEPHGETALLCNGP